VPKSLVALLQSSELRLSDSLRGTGGSAPLVA